MARMWSEIGHARPARTARFLQTGENYLLTGCPLMGDPSAGSPAVYLARKHTTLTNPEIGAYFGNVTFSAVANTVSRLRARMKEDRKVRQALQKLEGDLSTVKG